MAELADAQASGACGSNTVWVQVPSPASDDAKQDQSDLGFASFYVVNSVEQNFGGLCSI